MTMSQLQLQRTDGGASRFFDLHDGSSVGRTEGNDIVLDHASVSRRHAVFQIRGQEWWILDLQSTNGLKLNGQPTREARIYAGDKLLIGSVTLELRDAPPVTIGGESMFEDGGTVVRRISDFNLEFGLDSVPHGATVPGTSVAPASGVTREKIFSVLVQVAKLLLESEELTAVLNTVMDIIFKYLPVDRGLLILFSDDGEPIPKLTRVRAGSEREDIPISRTILKMVSEQQVALLTSNALEDARLLGGQSIAMHSIRSAMCVPLWDRGRVIGAIQVDSPIQIGQFEEEDLDLLTALANFAAVAIERAQLSDRIEHERKIREKLERYHSPGVVDEIVRGAAAPTEEAVRTADVSILFADISGFTTISETKQPEEVAEFLSHFFSCAVDAIFANGGTLDKFIGDAVMAFFGAPLAQDDHAARAVRAGLKMKQLVAQWNENRAAQGLDAVKIRIGVNSGPAVVGNVGTEKRVDYTVLGTSVNIASRMESGVALPGQLVVAQPTLDRIGQSFRVVSLGDFALKGLQQRMPVYEVLEELTGAAPVSDNPAKIAGP
ncbi:MAG: adenylate/guanylate cyclase domain-containing protein [Acidobacteriota bacterium]